VTTAVAYLRVSSGEQAERGASLEAQEQRIGTVCAERDWILDGLFREARSARADRLRPELERAMIRARELQGALIVARLDRAFRSALDFHTACARAHRERWALVCLHPTVDMTSAEGRMFGGIAAVIAEYESELISMRTRDAIAERRRRGVYRGGARLVQCSPYDGPGVRRIVALAKRHPELSLRGIAKRLELEGVPAPRGERWHHQSVAGVLRAHGLR
jgi:DNA invertase Pin-like site-specific DNA recombinase